MIFRGEGVARGSAPLRKKILKFMNIKPQFHSLFGQNSHQIIEEKTWLSTLVLVEDTEDIRE